MKDAKQEEWISGNRLIAEFMGYKLVSKKSLKHKYWEKPIIDEFGEDLDVLCSENKLEYHTSWDWLMPVVEKIPTLNPDKGRLWFEYEISRCHCRIYTNLGEEWKNNGGTTLEATWKTINDFLTWYNSITK